MRTTPAIRPVLIIMILAVSTVPALAEDEITQGALRYVVGEEVREFPLEHTDVRITVSGTVAEVTLTQVFSNPLAERLEAVYVFPLPDRAAVDDMSIRVGERLIEGEIHRREEARRIYDRARDEGRLAGLLDQERPNIFTQRLANILPGETVEVVIHYVEDLHFDHGTWRLVFPTVVGPRYIPGAPVGRSAGGWSPDTDRVPDASRITPPVLKPGERSGHDIAISVDLAPGFAIRELGSTSHEIDIRRHGRRRATVVLAPLDTIPNKDFVLTWSTAADTVESTLLTHRTGELGYISLILQPPARPRPEQVVQREVVLVLDTSGSMSGEPLAACKQLARKALKRLRPDDTFRLIRFAGGASQLADEALPATPVNVERALSWLDGMRGGGGTEMLRGVRAALEAPCDPYRLRMVLFLTDGYIGNEHEILARVVESLGSARIFSLGVGSSVNRFLLDRLAEAGRGVAEYLKPGESPEELVDRFYERITDPVFTQLEIDWGGLEVVDVEPAALPDLFAGQPLLVHARYSQAGTGTVTLRGWAGTERVEISTVVRLPRRSEHNAAQARLWARARIARLEMAKLSVADPAELVEEITGLALEHRLITAYTSFVAVDRSEVRAGGDLVTVDQPVPMPEGVSYEGVFGEQAAAAKAKIHVVKQVKFQPPPRRVPIPDPTPDEPEPVRAREGILAMSDADFVAGVPDAPPPPEPAQPLRYVVGGPMTEPVKISGANPVYPEAARRSRIQGVVVLETTIAGDGTVKDVKVLRGMPLGLSEAAVDAVKGWRFRPATLASKPIDIRYILTVRYVLGAVTAPQVQASVQSVAQARQPAAPQAAAPASAPPVEGSNPQDIAPAPQPGPSPARAPRSSDIDGVLLGEGLLILLLAALLLMLRRRTQLTVRRPRLGLPREAPD